MKFLVHDRIIIDLLQKRILQLAQSLPANPKQKDKIIQKYLQLKGYQFLTPKTKLCKHFLHKYHHALEQRKHQLQLSKQMSIIMVGNIQQLSVGAMCQILKSNIRKGDNPYEPTQGDQYQQQFIFDRDQDLFNKIVQLLHQININQIQHKKIINHSDHVPPTNNQKSIDKIQQFRKQMTIKQDGSLGTWGGKKYQGLGSQNVHNYLYEGIYQFQKITKYELLSTYFQSIDLKKKNLIFMQQWGNRIAFLGQRSCSSILLLFQYS